MIAGDVLGFPELQLAAAVLNVLEDRLAAALTYTHVPAGTTCGRTKVSVYYFRVIVLDTGLRSGPTWYSGPVSARACGCG
jgi:hypothetical protein